MTINNRLNITQDGLQTFDSTTGTFTPIDLTTKGDLLAHDGSNYQRFGVGTDQYVLKADSNESVGFRWACVAQEFISSQTASSSSTIEFNSFVDSNCYLGYRFVWKNVYQNADESEFILKFSIDNGSSFLSSGYKYAKHSIRADDTDILVNSNSASFHSINLLTGGDSDDVFRNGEICFFTSADPTNKLKQGILQRSYIVTPDSPQGSVSSRSSGLNTTTSEINAFEFSITTGTITYGEFFLYGIIK